MDARARRLVASLGLAMSACAAPEAPEAPTEPPAGLGFTHDNSLVERWPFRLDSVTTKIVAEPAAKDAVAASYWVVRAKCDPRAGELVAEIAIEPEFPDSAFAPLPEVDYRIVTGAGPRGANARELRPGVFEVRAPVDASTGAAAISLRAQFPGDTDGREPPKALLVRFLRIREEATGVELPLGQRALARWLIVDPD
jgi:hypothetical protein